jgi:hypothetical protein
MFVELSHLWHLKEPLLLKAISAKHRSRFAALSPEIVTTTMQIAEKIARAARNNCFLNCFLKRQNSIQFVIQTTFILIP